MADGKKSFVLYADLIHTVEKMPDEIAGKLLKHVLAYVNDRNPVSDDLLLNLVFEPIKQQMKRDLDKWEEIREKRIQAGIASAEAKKERASLANTGQQVLTPVQSVQQTSTLSTVNVNGNVTVNGNGTVKEKKEKGVTAPTHPLVIWINDNCPSVAKMKDPLTDEQADRLAADLDITSKAQGDALKAVITDMDNKPDLHKKYKSANLTIRKWWANAKKWEAQNDPTKTDPSVKLTITKGVYYK